MNLKKSLFFSLFSFLSIVFMAEGNEYSFHRTIDGITDEWHQILLPDEIFGNIRFDFNDIRIFGVTDNGDTIEAPYILRHQKDNFVRNEIQFRRINDAKRGDQYFFTFEIQRDELINEIDLDFAQQNFDWRIQLEGSNNQNDWFEILSDYRILAIKNEQTDYSFTKLIFSDSRYQFFRILIRSENKPGLLKASIWDNEVEAGHRINYPLKEMIVGEDKNQTTLDLALERKVPVSKLLIHVGNSHDYYRSFTIRYVADSFETEKGWKYNYTFLKSGTLSSLEENEFSFKSTILDKLQVLIVNRDNDPLDYVDCELWGYQYALVVRFAEKARYFLSYGNPTARKPNYDINHFQDQIPTKLTKLDLGLEVKFQEDIPMKNPLLISKIWLWIVLLLIISLLGYFSVKMIKSKQA